MDKKDGRNKKKVRWDARVGSKGEMNCYQWVLYNDLFMTDWGLYYYCPDGEFCDEDDWKNRWDRG